MRPIEDLLSLPGTRITTKFTQGCLRCHRAIPGGTTAACGSINYFTGDPVWMHPACARLTVKLGILSEIDDSWRVVTTPQRCADCRQMIVLGERFYNVWPRVPTEDPVLRRVCRGCHRIDVND